MEEAKTTYKDFLQPRDAWDALSMKEKAEMIGVAVRNGITNLNDIRDRYNEFAEGGDTKQPVTTGGAGYVPSTPDIDIRQRLYDNIIPFGYNNPVERIASAVFLNKPSDKQEYAGNRDILDDLWGTYLGIPKDRRHYDPVLRTSKYKPTNSKDNNQNYVSVPFANDDIDYIIKEALWQGERSQLLNPELGTFTVDTGRDKKGQYVSYYDKWDLNPFRGITNVGNKITKFLGLDKAGDLSFGIGKPIEIYDRIYLDDYYGIPKEYRGSSFLPEVVVEGRRKAEGGKIHIKPENRGKFTRLKERTGHSATWFKEHGTPAQKKMATFALNASHWKHGLGGNLFSGEEEGSQQMNIFRRPSGEYFYQVSPKSEEITVVPRIKVSDNPAYWTYVDASGKLYTPKQTVTSTQGEVIQTEAPSTWENIIAASNNNYMNPVLGAPARWKASWDNNTNAIRALWNNPAITGHPLGIAAKAVEYLASDEGIPKTIRLYQNSDGSENARWMWQRSLTEDALTSLGLFPAAAEGYQLGNRAIQRGRRFILDVEDRYQGMKDAAAYRSANGSMDARTIANTKWQENGGTSAGINKMGVNSKGDFGLFYPDDFMKGYYPSTAVEKGGEMTLTTHLGGDFPGEYSKDLLPMSKSEMVALTKYLKGIPERTYLGEVGKTKNYAEQYFNVKPSRMRAFKDAIHNRKEVNEPYWDEKGHIDDYMEEEDPIERSFYKHLYEANEPLSTDAYKFMLQEAAKDNGRFALRYDSSPMGLFNPQGFYENAFYESLLPLSSEEQVNAINRWMRSYYPKARPAYLKDGEVMIPRPFLMKSK